MERANQTNNWRCFFFFSEAFFSFNQAKYPGPQVRGKCWLVVKFS